MVTRRTAYIGIIVACVIVGLSVFLAIRAGKTSAKPPPTVSVLDTPTTPTASFPADIRPALESKFGSSPDAHLAFQDAEAQAQYYVIRDGDHVCLYVLTMPTTGSVMGGTCANLTVLASRAMFVYSPSEGGTFNVAGLVADGFTTATAGGKSAPVKNNVFAIRGVEPLSTLDVSGPSGTLHDDEITPASTALPPQTSSQ